MGALRPIVLAVAIAAAAPAAAATAAWTTGGGGAPIAKAVMMPAGNQPTVSVSNRSVTVSWSASNMPSGTAVADYVVKRYSAGGAEQTIGSSCSGTVSALSCTETGVPGGSWKYTVSPKRGPWTGDESPQSATAAVSGPSLSFSSSTTVTSLPTTLSGSIASFVGGQTVTFRLDDPVSGTVLSSTLSPTPVPGGGGSNVTVTIPSGTSSGAHTVYAVGSGGSDVASAGITVSPPATTVTTSAWDLRDASAGGAESNQSAQTAFASDSLTLTTGNWANAFSGTRWVEFNESNPLPTGQTVTGATFNFRYAASASGDTACYWFEVRRKSTGAVISGGTHGSTASPVGCTTGTAQTTTSTPLPELNTTALANDARIRVYGRNSGARPFVIDLATVTGSTPSTAFTLYPGSVNDAADGSAASTAWSIFAVDSAFDTTAASWATTFSATRYLKLTFPSYVPTGTTVSGATFKQSFRPTSSGRNACYYFEVYSGATLIGTHGSTGSPVACNSTLTYVSNTTPLPEINTPARANGAIVKVYFWVSGSTPRTTDHDLMELSVNYQ